MVLAAAEAAAAGDLPAALAAADAAHLRAPIESLRKVRSNVCTQQCPVRMMTTNAGPY